MKTIKIMACCAIAALVSIPVFAGPAHNCGGCRPPCRPCPCHQCHPHRHHHHCCGGSGIRLAADIVSLAGTSLSILRGQVYPAVAVPVPVQYRHNYVSIPSIYR